MKFPTSERNRGVCKKEAREHEGRGKDASSDFFILGQHADRETNVNDEKIVVHLNRERPGKPRREVPVLSFGVSRLFWLFPLYSNLLT